LLLSKGADVDQEDARCLIIDAKAGNELMYQILRKNTSLIVFATALMWQFLDEHAVIHWFSLYLQEQENHVIIGKENLIYECMSAFPTDHKLL
jgi:hypothetical protein